MKAIHARGKRGSWLMVSAAAVAGLAATQPTSAASYVWDGAGSDHNWETGSNWNPDGTPNSTADDVTFDGSVAITSVISLGASAKTIGSIYATGGSDLITIGSGGQQLSLGAGGAISRTGGSGWLLVGADLTLLGDATFNASGGGLTLIDGAISGAGGINITGDTSSYVYLRGNNSSYTGQITLSSGAAIFTSQAAFGSNTTTIVNGGRIVMGGGSITQDFTVNENAALSNTGAGGSYTGTWTIASGKTLALDTGGGNATTFSMVLAGAGNATFNNGIATPITVMNGAANTMTGTFTILNGRISFEKAGDAIAGALQINSTGEAILGAADQINDTAAVNLAGGTLRSNGFSDTAGVLTLSGNSSIDFGASGASTLAFADSSGASWTGGTSLTLINYGADSPDVLQVGTSGAGLSGGQLGQVRFLNPTGFAAGYYTATIDGSGFITPGSLIVLASTWTADADGNWTDSGNWSAGVPASADGVATFGSAISAPHTVTLTSDLTVKQVVFDNAFKYTIAGSNTLTLVDATPFVVTSGSHQISAPVVLLGTSDLAIGAGTTLALGTLSVSGSSFTSSGAGTLAVANLANATSVTVSGGGATTFGTLPSVTGANAVVLNSGTTTINGSNSYSGTTTVNTGATLVIGHNSALGSSTLVMGGTAPGTGFTFIKATGGAKTISNALTYTSMNVTGDTDITFTGNFTPLSDISGNEAVLKIENTGKTKFTGNLTITASNQTNLHLRGTGDVEFSGTWTNPNNNKTFEVGNAAVGGGGSYSGTVTFSGTTNLAANFVAGQAGNPSGINNGITIAVASSTWFVPSTSPPAVNNVMIVNSGVTLNAVGGTRTISRSDSRMFDVTFGGSEILDFTASNGLRVGGVAGTDINRVWNVTNTARVRANGLGQNGSPKSLTKTGSGILEIYGTGAVNFSAQVNNVTISAGTVMANNTNAAGALGAAAINVGASGTLGGTGRVGGAALTVNGVLSPGETTGTGDLDHNASVTFNSGSKLKIELAGTTPGDAASNYDQFRVANAASTLTVNSGATLEISALPGFDPAFSDVFYILTRADGGATGTFTGLAEGGTVNFLNGYSGKITYLADWTGSQGGSSLTGGNDVAIYNVAVPEPTGAALLLTAAGGLLARRRNRRNG